MTISLTGPAKVSEIDAFLSSILRGDAPHWLRRSTFDLSEFLSQAEFHGVSALLHVQGMPEDCPSLVVRTIRECAIQQAMWEVRHRQVLKQAIAALTAGDMHPVLIKGTALAYSLYASPVLRSRSDTDLIISETAKERAHQVLSTLGFERANATSGEFVSYQANYTMTIPDSGTHTIDLHWRINNSEVLAKVFTYDELRSRSQSLPKLCPEALGPCPVDALLIACMHRATHKQNPLYVDGVPRYEGNRLVWLYDIHLLARSLDPAQWSDFTHQACKRGLRAICLEGMDSARAHFHTVYPEAVIAALSRGGRSELASRYLRSGKLRQQWMDWLALNNWRNRWVFLCELFFPPRDYMRAKYGLPHQKGLPWMYIRRAAAGMAKSLAARRSGP